MVEKPKVSVIIPIYGVEKFLREALDSVINQTLKDIEIIAIDDGSKDNCRVIIDEYAAKDSRIRAIHKENGGYGQTCNLGIDVVNGDYIAIFEPDDYIDNCMYENLYYTAVEKDADIVKSSFFEELCTNNKRFSKKVLLFEDTNVLNEKGTINEIPELLRFHPSIWSCLFKKDFLISNNIRFVEAPGAGWTDNPFQVQTFCLAKKIICIPDAYYHWRKFSEEPSEELKDYKIPFKRSEEIHKWLFDNNINDKYVLSNLYKRELGYIHIVFGMKHILNVEDCLRLAVGFCKTIPADIIYNSGIFTRREKKFYELILKNPKLAYIKTQLKTYRRWMFSISIKKDKKVIKIFGKYLVNIRKDEN